MSGISVNIQYSIIYGSLFAAVEHHIFGCLFLFLEMWVFNFQLVPKISQTFVGRGTVEAQNLGPKFDGIFKPTKARGQDGEFLLFSNRIFSHLKHDKATMIQEKQQASKLTASD